LGEAVGVGRIKRESELDKRGRELGYLRWVARTYAGCWSPGRVGETRWRRQVREKEERKVREREAVGSVDPIRGFLAAQEEAQYWGDMVRLANRGEAA
jgi:hypothetical protein